MAEQLRQSTITVREELPPRNQITDKQIQDSLWYYYYDIEKTVKYLVKTYLEPPKEKKAPGGVKKNKGGLYFTFPF